MKVASAIVFGTGFTFSLGSPAFAADQLPVPCVGGTCGSGVPWVSSGQATAVSTGARLDITQTSNKATLNWQSFNVGQGNTVKFIQPGSDAVALNRIFQADPSVIQGSIQANGQLYLVNRNGIIFNSGAQVNAHSFTASSLDIADDVLEKGIFAPVRDGRPAFALTPKVDANGKPIPGGDVRVEAGASIKTDSAGRIMLLAPNVENKGTLQAPDGQVILAAGEKAWIADSSDPNLRGYLVEVDAGGTARNAGELLVDRGNISLVGLAVNQEGRASAKTAVSLAGSVRLVARDTALLQNGNVVAQRTGAVRFGENSVTEITPDLADTSKAVDDQAQPQARIEVMGKTIEVGKDARLVATSGQIDFLATTNPAKPVTGQTAGNGTRISIASGATLDVSGTKDVVLPMERNVLTVELRGNELRDSPEQRDGVLYGKKIQVDIRKGTPVADISGALATIQRGVGERTTAGGSISLRSEDAVNVGAGSKLDVSGGSVRYDAGTIATTKLLAQGQVIDISQADPNQHYDAVLTKVETTSHRWGVTKTYDLPGARSLAVQEEGYVEGKDAGSIKLLGTQMQMAGTLLGSTVKGRYQRDLPSAVDLAWSRPTSQLALGGQLIFGDPNQLGVSGLANFHLSSVLLQSPQGTGGLTAKAEVSADVLRLDPALFSQGGFTRIGIYSNGHIELPEDEQLSLAQGGELTLVSGSVVTPDQGSIPLSGPKPTIPSSLQIDGDITIPSGKITLRTVQTAVAGSGGTADIDTHHTLAIGSGAVLDVSGQWVNDTVRVAATLPESIIATRGGSVSLLSAGGVNVEDGASFLLNGGAWLDRTGTLKAGRGGDLSIASTLAAPPTLHLGGTAESFALSQGGTLSLSAGGIWIANDARNSVSDSVLAVNPDFFQKGGFSAYNLSATHFGVTVDEDTVVRPRAMNWMLDSAGYSAPTGTLFSSLVHTELLADYDRKPVNVSLTSTRRAERSNFDAGIKVARGAAIIADPGAKISLTSDRMIEVQGALRAPAGQIDLVLSQKNANDAVEFIPDETIRLGSQAVLSATGYVQLVPNALGLLQGRVLDAGTVSLRATDRGSLITDPGSLIDVSGTSGQLDILQPGAGTNPYVRTDVAGAAGSILMQAPDGMLLTGSMRANAASTPGARGGSLSLYLSGYLVPAAGDQRGDLKDPTGIRDVVFRTDAPDALFAQTLHDDSLFSAQDLAALRNANNKVETRGTVSLQQVQSAGFDDISVKVRPPRVDATTALNDARIVFNAGSFLHAGRSITLDAPILWGGGGSALIDAPYVALGPTDTVMRFNPAPVSGAGTLGVHADLIDLVGDLAIQGFGDASHAALSLESRGDIRLNGARIQNTVNSTGSLKVEGTLRMQAAQIYPTTLTQFTLQAVGPRSLVSIGGGDSSASVPLSAGGLLRIESDRIEVSGTVRAPHGQIVLDAADTLTLTKGSEVSVAGSTIPVPFGTTQFGRDWVLQYEPTLARVVEGDDGAASSTNLPEKRVDLSGENVNLESGAKVVLDGGGDLYASEFIPGPGGSKDVLLPENANGAFAIVPTLKTSTAPIDPFTSYTGLKVGDTIQIGAGTPDLPAGTYAVLPARYALLPGAVLLTPTGQSGLTASTTRSTLRGLPIIAGRRGAAMAGTFDSLWSGYTVENGAQVRERAEYRESLASKFFAGRTDAAMPADAGRLLVNAGAGLSLAGTVSAAGTGRGGQVDIAADNLSVVASLSGQKDRVELLASQLSNLRVESILLGGQRERTADGVRIEASASSVTVESGVTLEGPELMLVARPDGTSSGSGAQGPTPDDEPLIDGVHVASGATLRGVGKAVASPGSFILDGDTAFLRVSSGAATEVTRTGAPSGAGSAQIVLDSGSALVAGTLDGQTLKGGSITIDSSGNAVSSAALTLGTQGALQLAASRISLGGDASALPEEGLALSRSALSGLNVSNLSLKSRTSIDILGDLDFGVSGTLTLDTPLLQGVADEGTLSASLHANTLRWRSSTAPGATGAPAVDPIGQLTLSASTLLLGDIPRDTDAAATPSNLNVGGFASTRLEGTSQFVMNGTGSLQFPGALEVVAPWVTTADGANWNVKADGVLSISSAAAAVPVPTKVGLGSTLALSGASVTLAGGLLLPAGSVSLTATGDGEGVGSVHLTSNALINAAAVREYFLDKAVETPGGRVALASEHGDVLIDSGAKIDVSGKDGAFSVRTPGVARLDGSFVANSGGLQEGNFALIAGQTTDFSALNRILNAGGFGASRSIRLGSGDATIGAGETIRARDVSITLDNGSFYLGGVIDASGDSAGQVQISARNDVTLGAGSRIDASAHGENRLGGNVVLGSTAGTVAVDAGATIDVRGTRKVFQDRQVLDPSGQPIQRTDANGAPLFDSLGLPIYVLEQVAVTDTGHVRYRMPASILYGPSSRAISTGGTVLGAGAIDIEGFNTYVDSDIDANDVAPGSAMFTDAANFMSNESSILASLGVAGDKRYHLLAGIEIDSLGDMTLSAQWNLADWRFGADAQPGVLTLRAGGNLLLNQSLSDGVDHLVDPLTGMEKDFLRNDRSWTYNLIAGADLSSASGLATAAGLGDIIVGGGTAVRTGTGDITVRAGRDVVLADQTSVLYTAGRDAGLGTLDPQIVALSLNGVYPQLGGSIDIGAGRDVTGQVNQQFVNDWLWRIGGNDPMLGEIPKSWNVSLTDFHQGVAAFGGGNIKVTAGGDVRDLAASVPTTGRQVGDNVFDPLLGKVVVDSDKVIVDGGDSLRVRAGGDIIGGEFFMGRGTGELTAGGSVTRRDDGSLYAVLALGDGEWQVTAGRDAAVETVFDPMVVPQALQQGIGQLLPASFDSYTDRSALNLLAIAGEARLNQFLDGLKARHPLLGNGSNDPAAVNRLLFYPGSVQAASLRSDLVIQNSFTMVAAPAGELNLFAGDSILPGAGGASVLMLDVPDAPPSHLDDLDPVRVVARNGDIGGSGDILGFDLPKSARLDAGGDILNVRLNNQNLHDQDVTSVTAGGNITHETVRSPNGTLSGTDKVYFRVAGPGRVDLLAGGDIDLGTAGGILTTGNLNNAFLPTGGASVTAVAGLREPPRFDAFIEKYLVSSKDYKSALAKYLSAYKTDPSRSDIENFRALPIEQQRPFLWQTFFDELRTSGVDATKSGSNDFSRGYAAIDVLFPESVYSQQRSHSDLSLLLSQISTLNGGDINLIVPGGAANAGVATTSQLIKQPSQLGVVVQRAGNVNAFTRGDFLVNQSRVFTLDGGSILMWSSKGNIDAGRGAKTALTASPPVVTIDSNGNTVIQFPPAIAGSGIRSIVTTPGTKPGDVYLFAPAGVVSAGDAGIGSAGNVIIGAVQVIGADNIDVGGVAIGIPVDTGGLAASLSSVSAVASGASEASLASTTPATPEEKAPLAESALGWLDVFVEGFGEETCKPADAACLERQRKQ